MEQMDKRQVLRRLSMAGCIGLMRTVLQDDAEGKSRQYLRTVTPLPGNNLLGFMPALPGHGRLFWSQGNYCFSRQSPGWAPSHQGSVLLFDAEHGALRFMADGDAITQIRTGAVSAVATDLLARPDAKRLALLGAGAQGRSHLEAMALVRRLTEVTVWDVRPENARRFAGGNGRKGGLSHTRLLLCGRSGTGRRYHLHIDALPYAGLGKQLGKTRRPHQRRGRLFCNRPGVKLRPGRPLPFIRRQHRIGGKGKRRLFNPFVRGRNSKRASAGHHRAASVRRNHRAHISAGRDALRRAGPCHRGRGLCQIPLSCGKGRKLA